MKKKKYVFRNRFEVILCVCQRLIFCFVAVWVSIIRFLGPSINSDAFFRHSFFRPRLLCADAILSILNTGTTYTYNDIFVVCIGDLAIESPSVQSYIPFYFNFSVDQSSLFKSKQSIKQVFILYRFQLKLCSGQEHCQNMARALKLFGAFAVCIALGKCLNNQYSLCD